MFLTSVFILKRIQEIMLGYKDTRHLYCMMSNKVNFLYSKVTFACGNIGETVSFFYVCTILFSIHHLILSYCKGVQFYLCSYARRYYSTAFVTATPNFDILVVRGEILARIKKGRHTSGQEENKFSYNKGCSPLSSFHYDE